MQVVATEISKVKEGISPRYFDRFLFVGKPYKIIRATKQIRQHYTLVLNVLLKDVHIRGFVETCSVFPIMFVS